MKKRLVCLVLAFIFIIGIVPALPRALAAEDDGLHSIYELNTEDDPIDSHAGVTHLSTLELDRRNSYHLKNEDLIEKLQYYSKLAE